MKKLWIVGGGMGSGDLLTEQARKALTECERIFAFDRMAELNEGNFTQITVCSYTNLFGLIESATEDCIGVLLSGDVGFFSAAQKLQERFSERFQVENICGISSLQYLCGKLGIGYEKVHLLSLHGRNSVYKVLSAVTHQKSIFLLTGGENRAEEILRFLSDKLPADICVTAGTKLSMEGERIVTGTVAELAAMEFDGLTVLLLQNPRGSRPHKTYFDTDFIRGNTPMTKQEVRWVTVKAMDISPDDIVFDIGAGTGSVAIEMAAQASSGVVYAIEREEEAYALLHQNKEKQRVFHLLPIFGRAMEVLEKLPTPDKVFIGGSGKEMEKIVSHLLEKNRRVKLFVNAVTLETLTETLEIFQRKGLSYQVSCINSASSKEMGSYHMMIANNPVYLIAGEADDL